MTTTAVPTWSLSGDWLGVMNLVAVGGVAALVYAEKVLPHARAVRQVAGAVLVAYGPP
jgi:predicted metal-binding membrane protein